MESHATMQGDFLGRFCRANEGQLETYLTQMVGSADIARELVKDSFARVQMSRPEHAAFPRAALFNVATNLALLHLRRRRAERMGLEAAVNGEDKARVAVDERVPQDRLLSAEEYGASLATAIKALRLAHRKVFVMAHVQGKLRKEIAAVLGISETRVDKRMTKALKAVRDYLSARGIDPADMFALIAMLPLACLLSAH
ncbi:MAG TPA: sigma-70 family RNA polymerase sigma factor [Steroidobacteraceae bacterium]|nr:sigma-70 family RNA polymerase sigma factor [Steroidobacteraceae bacterium]